MIDLEQQKVVVLVFAMHGCPACDHYLPRFTHEATQLGEHGVKFAVNPEAQPPQGTIPVLVFDAAADNDDVQKLADRFGVTATPTTILAAKGAGSFKVEGSLANNQIQWILMMASEANQ